MADSQKGPVRFGLVGFGAWGLQHARAIAKTRGAELVAIVSRSEENQKAARSAHPNATLHTDLRVMLDKERPDVVDIVLPSHLHFEAARLALESGAHVLLEKPMCLNLPDCDKLLALAREKQRLLSVGHEFRLSSLWGRVKEMVGRLGDLRYCLIELWRRPYRQGTGNWRYNINEVGSWILEEPIHFFDLARWYFEASGTPVSVVAHASNKRPESPELLDNFSAMLCFSNGGYAVIAQSLAAYEHHQTVKLTGTRGALWAKWSGVMDRTLHPTFSLHHFDGEKVHDITPAKITGEVYELEDEMENVAAAVRGGPLKCATGEDGRWSVAMCLKAQESVERGAVLNF
jgi:myo-inositol 2-dehydrogenase/D-chiro-inositol 1-dehydrogenase